MRSGLVLYGPRRIGKTSLIRSLAVLGHFGGDTSIVPLNLQSINWAEGQCDLCYTLAWTLWYAQPVNDEPNPDKYDPPANPWIVLHRWLTTRPLTANRIILILDEYEQITDQLAPPLAQASMTHLVQLTREFPWLTLAVVGATLPAQCDPVVYAPLAAWPSLLIGGVNQAAVRAILMPDADSPQYSADALDAVYALTAGVPYLIQWLGATVIEQRDQEPTGADPPLERVKKVPFALMISA